MPSRRLGCFPPERLAERTRGPLRREGGGKGGGMPIPRIVRQWNKAGLNRVTKHIAPWAPGLGVVIHHGRRSGRLYHTPVNVFAAKDGCLFAGVRARGKPATIAE
jgi:hypothetical protein